MQNRRPSKVVAFDLQRGQREREQMQKTTDALEDLESRLEGWATVIEAKVMLAASADRTPEVIAKLNETESMLGSRLDKLHEVGNSWKSYIE